MRGALAVLLAAAAFGQQLDRTCLPGNDLGNGLEVAVDGAGWVHLSRVGRVSGSLLHTEISPDGGVQNTTVAQGIGLLLTAEVEDTGLLIDGDQIHICFQDARRKRMEVASRVAGVWSRALVEDAVNGGACDLALFNGKLTVAYQDDGRLRVATRNGANWSAVTADSLAGAQVGEQPSIAVAGAAIVVAHRDTSNGSLRITHLDGGLWRSLVAPAPYAGVGLSPRAVFDDGDLLVFHGAAPNNLDVDPDIALLATEGRLGGAFQTRTFFENNVGGYVGAAASAGELTVFTREYARSALFGAFDGLYMYRGRGYATTVVESNGSQARRHVYRYLSAAHDPFGLPVLAYLDERGAFFGEPAEAPVCFYRPADADGDALPDEVEAGFGTEPEEADTDGDGRTDGEEVLIDGTDPTTPDGCDPTPETCNGIDDDCDDAVDEDLQRGCYPGPAGTSGVGRCRGGQQVCGDGVWGACAGAVIPTDEVCNGADDDCDGAIDEGNPGGGGACDTGGVGACGAGALTCVGGRQECLQVSAPSAEVCDGRDNDCDGETDEGQRSCGVGMCFREVPVCVDGHPNPCVPGQPAPADDVCDGLDEDCDGRADEDYEGSVTTCGEGVCFREGAAVCVDGVPQESCTPGAPGPNDAACDGLDEDCDGATDEDFLERASQCGVGGCRAQGRVRCVGGEVLDDCAPGQPGADDDCDGVDDDCDGLADEGYPVEPTECGVAVCAATGERRCVEGAVVDTCAPRAGAPDDRTCDGVDDDCDGATDEDYAGRDTVCGAGACEAQGRTRCVAGRVVNGCVPGLPGADDASCDGVDDDCDGATDEDHQPSASVCGDGACAAVGQVRCVDGVLVDDCAPEGGAPTDRKCDGIDADCDGEVDEDYRPADSTCGVGVCARAGRTACVDGAVVDDCAPGAPQGDDSVCDGLDQDCDGAVDEAFVGGATECGRGVCAAVGAVRCVGGVEVDTCEPGPANGPDEDCDTLDDDCDGRVDEFYVAPRTTCGDAGCRASGRLECRDGALVDTCEPGPGSPTDATCDAFDDDCDGRLDEDYEPILVGCGAGACSAVGTRECVDGVLVLDCVPAGGAVDDVTCDGRDDDCDQRIDEDFAPEDTACGVGACAAVGRSVCEGGVERAGCEPGAPAAADVTCDGVDDDCDGAVDEGYAPRQTQCGVGACVAVGETVCVDGQELDGCVPGAGQGADDDCDGVDDDCDGSVDEAFQAQQTSCGLGVCARAGQRTCEGGRVVDSCVPAEPVDRDRGCDGEDTDCDGRADEGYRPVVTSCGIGVCAAQGQTACVGGQVSDDCEAGAPQGADEDCDGADQDCDGRADEGYAVTPTACGQGVCAAVGERRCVAGEEVDTCLPAPGAAQDARCDGRDEDCDGALDEDYAPAFTRCGRGACEAAGRTACVGGEVVDDCEPGAPAASDSTCDGGDDDCDATSDEDYAPVATRCGAGACAADGERVCAGGVLRDTCRPGAPAADDGVCDGVDADCDGRADEDYAARATRCGVGACARQAATRCEAGQEVDPCEPGAPAARDASCDGRDDDCDGRADEDYAPRDTACGQGACAAGGRLTCVAGREVDDCRPGVASFEDATCDGRDEDCDGRVDEDFVSRVTECGVGACASRGRSVCVGGVVEQGCTPGEPAARDATCDAVDDDCDRVFDEDFEARISRCGVGACASEGRVECRSGRVADTCVADLPSPADPTCDGVDDDCDGRVDEDFPARPSACGVGACQAEGELRCVDGEVRDSCRPRPAAPGDTVCDGVDEDCDGVTDEEYAPGEASCGTGACRRVVLTVCVDGLEGFECEPGAPVGEDARCDAVDEDCDGAVDEAFVEEPTVCGVGACAAAGHLRCVGGREVDDCEEGAPAAADGCGGADEDCDEVVDEDCPADAGLPPDARVAEPDAAVPDPDGAMAEADAAADGAAAAPDAEEKADAGATEDGGRVDSGSPDGGSGDARRPEGSPDAAGQRPDFFVAPPPDALVVEDGFLNNPPPDFEDLEAGEGDGGEVPRVASEGCACDAPGGGVGVWWLLAPGLRRRRRRARFG